MNPIPCLLSPTLLLQITDLQSEHLKSVCAGDWEVRTTSRTPWTSLPWKGDNEGSSPTHPGTQTVLKKGVKMHCAARQVKAT